MTFFVSNDNDGYDPRGGILAIANCTMNSTSNLFPALITNVVPAPAFLASWLMDTSAMK